MKHQLVKLILFAALAVAGVWGASAETVGVKISVNGGDAVDVGTGSGDGWNYSNEVLILDKANAFTLSGSCSLVDFRVGVTANAAITLSNVCIKPAWLSSPDFTVYASDVSVTLVGTNDVCAAYGAPAFRVTRGAKLTMGGDGVIRGSKAPGYVGCCVEIQKGGSFALDGGTIRDYGNSAVSNYGSFEMNGGVVADCSGIDSAFLKNCGKAVIYGGSINNCSGTGSAYISGSSGSSCTVYGGYFGCADQTWYMYFNMPYGATLIIYGAVVDNTIAILKEYHPEHFKAPGTVCATVGKNYVVGSNVTESAGQLTGGTYTFHPLRDEYKAAGLQIAKHYAVFDQGTTPETYKVHAEAEFYVNGVRLEDGPGDGWTAVQDGTAGRLTLAKPMDYELSGYADLTLTVDVLSNATVTLNGIRILADNPGRDIFHVYGTNTTFVLKGTNTVYANDGNAAIGVRAGARLKVRGQRSDSGDSDCLVGGRTSAANGRGFYVNANGELVLEGGSIRDYYCFGKYGAGVDNWGAFTMNGGTINGCSAGQGGAIYNGGTLTVYGGTINECQATGSHSGGGALFNDGTVNIYGGTFKDNHATAAVGYGGFCYNNDDKVVSIYGGCFSGHTANNCNLVYCKDWMMNGKLYGGVFAVDPTTYAESHSHVCPQNDAKVGQVGALYVVGKDVSVATYNGKKLSGGTYTFNPTNAEYAAAGVEVMPNCGVETDGTTTPVTYEIVRKADFRINGEQIGQGSGEGWSFDFTTGLLTLSNAVEYLLSGYYEMTPALRVDVTTNAAITLDGVRIHSGALGRDIFNIAAEGVTVLLTGTNEVYATDGHAAFGIASGASLTMDGTGALWGGKAAGANGRCIAVASGGAFTMDWGQIRCYSATENGSAIDNLGTVTVKGGVLAGNGGASLIAGVADVYGGVFMDNECTTFISGTGTIYGGVVDVEPAKTKIAIGYAVTPVGDLYVIGKDVTETDGRLTGGIYTFDPQRREYVAVGLACAENYDVMARNTTPKTFRVYEAPDFRVNGVRLREGPGEGWSIVTNETELGKTVSLTLSSATNYTLTGHTDITLTVDVLANATVTLEDIRLRAYSPARSIFSVSAEDVTFVLKGTNTVFADDGNAAIGVTAGARLKVRGQRSDGGDGDCLVGGRASGVNGCGFYVNVNGELVIESGTIRDYYATDGGAGVDNWGAFTMNGGTISGCSADGSNGDGGGVYNHCLFTMNGGTISGCSASSDGGAIYNGGTLAVYGGTINGCSAINGGALFNHDTANIYGGTFTGNSALSWGGFCYCNKDRTVSIYGGYFSGNSVPSDGCNLFTCYNLDKNGRLYGGVFAADPMAYSESRSRCLVLQGDAEVRQVGDLWVVGTGVQSDAGKLLSGTCTFSPTNAEYVAAGLALSPGCEVSEKATEPKTYVVTDESLTLTALTDASAVSLNWTSAETVLYRLSDGSWTDYAKGATVNLAEGERVSFAGTRVKTDADSHFAMRGSLAASGHVTALWSGLETDRAAALEADCFACLFQNCVSLATAPGLPSTVLPDGCYRELFKGCTGLSVVPDLAHVTSVGSGSCAEMFAGCTGIRIFSAARDAYEKEWLATSAAETAPEDWSTDMFKGTSGGFLSAPTAGAVYYLRNDPCYLTFTAEADGSSVSLAYVTGSAVQYRLGDDGDWLTYTAGTEIALAKTGDTVAFCGYNVMTDPYNHFTMSGRVSASGSVTSLTDAYGADAGVELDEYCYDSLFADCTALVRAPALPAKNLSSGCYFDMFAGCTSLVEVATLPSLSLPSYCYAGMFLGCTSLRHPADLSSVLFLGEGCCMEMFADCTGIQLCEEPAPGCVTEWKATSAEVIGDAWNEYMFAETSGDFTGDPVAGETYYEGARQTLTGVLVDGVDAGWSSGDGWTYADGVLSLSGTAAYELSGENTNGNFAITVIANAKSEIFGDVLLTNADEPVLRAVGSASVYGGIFCGAFERDRYGALVVHGGAADSAAIGDYKSAGLDCRAFGEAYVVGSNIVQTSGGRLQSGTFTFCPTNAVYAAAGLVLEDDRVVKERATTPVTWTVESWYPGYLATWGAAVSNRFDTWAATFGSRDPGGVYANAFLLNVATNREAEAVGAFAIGSIVVTNGIVDIMLPKPLAPATAFNGAAYLQCTTNLPSAAWNDIESGRYVEESESFFRLKLDFEHTLTPETFPTEPEGTKTHRLLLR